MNHDTYSLEACIAWHREQGAPDDQQMLIALLREAQQLDGGALRPETIAAVARDLPVQESMLGAIIRRIPALRMADAPHRLDVCGGCDGAQSLLDDIRRIYQVGGDGLSRRGGFILRVTGCMKRCGRGPAVRWDGKTYDEADMDLICQLCGQ